MRGEFVLRSGARSSYYIDKYRFTTRPELLQRIAVELVERLPEGVQRIAAPGFGALQLATAVSLARGIPTLVVRTERKEYGTARQIEGALQAGERVLLLEDVVTTAGAALETVRLLREAGAQVLGALVVVDREQGGAEAFAAAGVPYEVLFTKTSLGL